MVINPSYSEIGAMVRDVCFTKEFEKASIACSAVADVEFYGMEGVAVDFFGNGVDEV